MPRLARQRAAERLGVLGAGALGVDQLGTAAQALDLVLHERDERRDDQRERLGVLERRGAGSRATCPRPSASLGARRVRRAPPRPPRAGPGGSRGGRSGVERPSASVSRVVMT